MSTHAHVWLIWSGAFLLSFALVFASAQGRRRMMLRAAAATMPFGLTEPLFVPEYWNPPSLFDLAQRTGFDLESLIFAFAIGGIAVVLYDRLTGHVLTPVSLAGRTSRRHRLHGLALLTPAFLFVALSSLGWNPIYPAVLAMAGGAAAAVLCRPDLLMKTVIGGLLFLAYYAIFMLGLTLSVPGYVEHVWNLPALQGPRLWGVPAEELLFGFSFGLYWSGVYEHLTWSRSAPARP
jgi:hypothetical protein